MKKQEFIARLRARLSGLPKYEVEERISFYKEMIDDRIEEGCSEEKVIAEMGSIDAIASQIASDIPSLKIAKNKLRSKRRLRTWEIVLLILGFPLWFSLLVAAFAVGLSLYVTLWSVIGSLWAVFTSVVACGIAGVVAGIGFVVGESALTGVATIGAGFVCAGLAIFVFFGCRSTTEWMVLVTQKIVFGIRRCFAKRGENDV